MKILSLFDGISCARVALERAGIPVEGYYASEVDKYAIEISKKNYPDIIRLDDVRTVGKISKLYQENRVGTVPDFDLLIGGSPCQDLSIAKKNRKGLDGERSGLFWEYVRILKEVKPKYFILENVASMSRESKDMITQTLGVEPIMINAALISAQNRKRLFWVGIRNEVGIYTQVYVTQPEDRGILLKDILESGESDRLKSYCIDASYYKGANWKQYKEKGRRQLIRVGSLNSGGQGDRIYSPNGKSVGLSALGAGKGAKTGLYHVPHGYKKEKITEEYKYPTLHAQSPSANHLLVDPIIRKLTPIECERLQGLPDNYTEGISNTQRYKCLGNAFNVDVVAHILSFIKNDWQ